MRYIACILIFLAVNIRLAQAQTPERPLILPMQAPPGIDTWLLGQPYGNTTGAFNFGSAWYSAGQGLHFGIDFSMPCQTPLVAVAAGTVVHVDNFGYGSRPHNLLIRHDALGLISLYGHLFNTPDLVVGQAVTQGQFVGYSGDPDVTCESRPHLHYELRSLDYLTTYNPVPYMDANWHSMALIGSFGGEFFQQDLYNARRWMSLDDQPNVNFGGARLNAYTLSSPPSGAIRPPTNTELFRELPALTEDTSITIKQIGYDNCCHEYGWHPTQPDIFYTVDGSPGQQAAVFTWSAESGTMTGSEGAAPAKILSPDGTLETLFINNAIAIRRISDGSVWTIPAGAGSNLPGISADNTRLVWWQQSSVVPPGQDAPEAQLFISTLDGQNVQQLMQTPGISARWLDNTRLLISVSQRPNTSLMVFDTATNEAFTLGTWYRLRGVTVAPGGGRILFYLASQPDPTLNGVYTMPTVRDAVPEKLAWFGGWRWRDANSVYYVPFDPTTDIHQLRFYDFSTKTDIALTDPTETPFTIMNGKWEVSPDGRWIAFHNAFTRNLSLLEIQ
jgi:hypothetical protein